MFEELLRALIIALGNAVGIAFSSWLLVDRRIDKKVNKYWRRIRESPEGKDAIRILEETRKLLESPDAKEILNEVGEVVSEVRVLLKQLKERFEAGAEEEEDEEPFELPKIEKN